MTAVERDPARPAPGLISLRPLDLRRCRGWRAAVKRSLDLLAVLVTLPLTLVAGTVIGIAVKATSRGPALFVQTRIGRHGRKFRMLKFRTMQADAEHRLLHDPQLMQMYMQNDHKLPAEIDPRMTPLGRLLRRTSLDEVPQLLNILAGSMSMVGPRPVTPEQLADWGDRTDAYLAMRPGLTGMWQINGRAGVKADGRIAYDEEYVKRWSLLLDARILVLTPITVFARHGAH